MSEEQTERADGRRKTFPSGFHRLPAAERRRVLEELLPFDEEEKRATCPDPFLLELSDLMVESSVGSVPVPLSVASRFPIDGEFVHVPMAVEEPSVVAAATYAARILGRGGGLSTWSTDPVMTAQVFLTGVPESAMAEIARREHEIGAEVDRRLSSLEARGGGFRGIETARLAESGVVRVQVRVDVRDAMGANILDTAAELVSRRLEAITGGRALMGILTNAAEGRRAGAVFRLPHRHLVHATDGAFRSEELAARIVTASMVAQEDPRRAVTHNKGIMNGISSLALATGNDTRAVEAGAHAWAARDGCYRGLSTYRLEDGELVGSIELPLALGTVGGAVGFHPATRFSLRILDWPDARRLARIAAALGLAQNFAALLALVSGGIQRGHMRLHAARVAYRAGARGAEVELVRRRMVEAGRYDAACADRLLKELRRDHRRGADGGEAERT